MKKTAVLACVFSGLTLTALACSEGAHTDLSCDATYQAQCLDTDNIMVCQDGKLTTINCGAGSYCKYSEASVNPETGEVTPEGSACVSSAVVCDCKTGLNCTKDEVLLCQKPACDCETGLNCSDAELEACEAGTICDCKSTDNCTADQLIECLIGDLNTCDCETGENCTEEQKAECLPFDVPSCDCETGEGCSDSALAACDMTCETVCKDGYLQTTCNNEEDSAEFSVKCAVSCNDAGDACKDMVLENIGGKCDAGYADRCVGNILGYCSEKGISASYCGGDSSCQISSKLGGYGDCVKKCETPSDVTSFCEYNENYGVYMYGKTVCEAIDGENYEFNAVEDYCYTGCNADNTGCALETEYDDCDPANTPDTCSADGSYTIYCEADEEFMTGDVCLGGTKCMLDSDGVAGCYEPCTAAEAGKKVGYCFEEEVFIIPLEYAAVKVCTEIADGVYAYVTAEEDYEVCAHGCSSETNKCVVLDETEEQACDPATYVSECKGDYFLSCMADHKDVYATDCKAYGDAYTCGIVDGKPACIEPCNALGDTRSICEDGLFGSALVSSTCIDNKGSLVWSEAEPVYMCSGYCTEDGKECERLVENEYTECDDSFQDKCIDGSAVFCDEGRVAALDCASDNQLCVVDGNNYADCYDLCMQNGKVTHYCDEYVEQAVTYVCNRQSNGVLINVPVKVDNCTKGCNKDNTACAE